MWIVRLSPCRPRTIAVMAILIAILPTINIPVVNVIWSYGGLAPQEMEGRVIRLSEAVLTTAVGAEKSR